MEQKLPKYVSGKVARTVLGIAPNTLRKWGDAGKIATIRNCEKGKRFYDISSFCKIQDIPKIDSSSNSSNKKKSYCYCRVSTRNQKDDLQRQVNEIRSKFPDAIIIQDIGSGINWKRHGFITLLHKIKNDEVEQVIICYKDRLCRFAFELLEYIFNMYKVKIMVLHEDSEKSPDAELAEDILSIMHVFSCKQMGKRRYKKNDKQEKINIEQKKEN